MIGRALRRYLANLSEGDPIAIGLTILFVLMAVFVAVIWLVDLAKKRNEAQKRRPGPGKGTRPRTSRDEY